ncbi:hypothetical protein GH714_005217 [Hevea brasiliensis]|uniref:Terpene cyclase/mutase family member n=1 Tax=Hevea brasiliensis TaxID=3981 RepID=A0A6A6LVE5_HEVBR|nr:hypothetical protein GH714_005217 [Hevea brasiliensis]
MWKLEVAKGDDSLLFSTNNFVGRQVWKFDRDYGTLKELEQLQKARENFSQNRFQVKASSDVFKNLQLIKESGIDLLSIPAVRLGDKEDVTVEKTETALRKAFRFTSAIQASDGHWPSEFSAQLFLTPPLIICLYVTRTLDTMLSFEHKKEMLRYIYNHQNEDGGWGFHIESHSTMLCTALNYVALRLLGEEPEGGKDGAVAKGRKWILDHGGAISIQIWGKIYLSVLGVYEWAGCNPVPPELLLVPTFLPFSSAKLWCYLRTIYTPIAYLYGKRFVGPITNLVVAIRSEIYIQPYDQIDWNKARHLCLQEDLYIPRSLVQNVIWDGLYYIGEALVKRWPFSKLRDKALEKAMRHIRCEDENTRYLTHACLEKALHMFAYWAEDPTQEAFKLHLPRVPDYLWVAEDGMKMQNLGCQLWDAVFATQAVMESDFTDEYGSTLRKAHEFIKQTQILENRSGDYKDMYWYISKGAWPLADGDQGWQVSDCTAEALKVLLLMSEMPSEMVGNSVETKRLYDAVDFLLTLQSKNGGFSIWEPASPHPWLELLNPTEAFSGVVVEIECVECTGSILQALVLFKRLYPRYRTKEVEIAVAKATDYIENAQKSDGSWYGNWGICHTYAAFFALRGLAAAGKTCRNSEIVRKACDLLLSKRVKKSGGWGESYLSCRNLEYIQLEGNRSNLVQTAWAMMGLIHAGQVDFRLITVSVHHLA